jgi:hypothetical protein
MSFTADLTCDFEIYLLDRVYSLIWDEGLGIKN